jgi:hypothetical protein
VHRSDGDLCKRQDDHDYGVNNGGAAYLEREQTKQLFLDFFDEPKAYIYTCAMSAVSCADVALMIFL